MSSVSIHGRRLRLTAEDNLITNGNLRMAPLSFDTLVTSAQILALNATPKTLLAAPGAGRFWMILGAYFYMPYNSAAYGGIAAGEDLAIRYTDSSGAIVATLETTGFLDQTATQYRVLPLGASPAATAAGYTPASNAAVVLHMTTGEITTGNSPLYVKLFAQSMPLTITL